ISHCFPQVVVWPIGAGVSTMLASPHVGKMQRKPVDRVSCHVGWHGRVGSKRRVSGRFRYVGLRLVLGPRCSSFTGSLHRSVSCSTGTHRPHATRLSQPGSVKRLMQDMDDATLVFERLRPRLHGIAYRMLGSAAEAEKVMQDAWLRWQEAAEATLERAEARLVFLTPRLCLRGLRQRKQH